MAQNFAAFFTLPRQFSFFLLSLLGGPCVEFWWCLKRRGPEMCTFGVLGLSCEAPAAPSAEGGPSGWWSWGRAVRGRRGGAAVRSRVPGARPRKAVGASHDSPRTPNVHISGPRRFKHHQNSTKGPPREMKERKLWREREKKSAKFHTHTHTHTTHTPHTHTTHTTPHHTPHTTHHTHHTPRTPHTPHTTHTTHTHTTHTHTHHTQPLARGFRQSRIGQTRTGQSRANNKNN